MHRQHHRRPCAPETPSLRWRRWRIFSIRDATFSLSRARGRGTMAPKGELEWRRSMCSPLPGARPTARRLKAPWRVGVGWARLLGTGYLIQTGVCLCVSLSPLVSVARKPTKCSLDRCIARELASSSSSSRQASLVTETRGWLKLARRGRVQARSRCVSVGVGHVLRILRILSHPVPGMCTTRRESSSRGVVQQQEQEQPRARGQIRGREEGRQGMIIGQQSDCLRVQAPRYARLCGSRPAPLGQHSSSVLAALAPSRSMH